MVLPSQSSSETCRSNTCRWIDGVRILLLLTAVRRREPVRCEVQRWPPQLSKMAADVELPRSMAARSGVEGVNGGEAGSRGRQRAAGGSSRRRRRFGEAGEAREEAREAATGGGDCQGDAEEKACGSGGRRWGRRFDSGGTSGDFFPEPRGLFSGRPRPG
jgi:hypothetical protein